MGQFKLHFIAVCCPFPPHCISPESPSGTGHHQFHFLPVDSSAWDWFHRRPGHGKSPRFWGFERVNPGERLLFSLPQWESHREMSACFPRAPSSQSPVHQARCDTCSGSMLWGTSMEKWDFLPWGPTRHSNPWLICASHLIIGHHPAQAG